MPRRTVKNFVRKSLSLSHSTVLKGLEILRLYQNTVGKQKLRNVPESEVYELALNIGFEYLEKALTIAKENNVSFEIAVENLKIAEEYQKQEGKTIADLTDEDLQKLMSEEGGE